MARTFYSPGSEVVTGIPRQTADAIVLVILLNAFVSVKFETFISEYKAISISYANIA
jgi:hypothetical protein